MRLNQSTDALALRIRVSSCAEHIPLRDQHCFSPAALNRSIRPANFLSKKWSIF